MDVSNEITDDYNHSDVNLEYILENVLSEKVKSNICEREDCKNLNDLFNTILINKCKCEEENRQHQCLNCSHGSNYRLDEDFQELVLSNSQNIPDLIYECTRMCTCMPGRCVNRLVQYGPRKFLKIVDSARYRSKGLVTTRDVPKGAFICEYAGELLTKENAKNILRENEMGKKMNYVLFLKEMCLSASSAFANETLITIVDPCKKGNIGRYLNHSCEPNCQIVSVRIDCPIPKIAIFSNRHITSGEEVCFNYNEGVKCKTENVKSADSAISRIPCLCGAKNCVKYLPNSEC